MNRKIKIYSFLAILLIGLLIFACNKEWLDTKPIAIESSETFYSNMEAADMAVTACYSIFNLEKVWDLSIVMTMGSIASDEAECGAGGKDDVPEYQHIDQLSHIANEAQVFDWTWGYVYRAVGACNLALERLPKISAETDPNFNAALMQKRLGEVYFLRAFNYFYLTLMYGGVPLVDHTLTPAEYNMKRNEISEVFGLMKSDLIKAINSLPLRSGWGDQVGRASKGAAQAMMAKVYLYESSYAKYYSGDSRFAGLTEHWDSAAYWAEQVIASDEYQLIGINGERFDTWRGPSTGGYSYIFIADANNSLESIFDIQCRNDDLNWFNSRGNSIIRWAQPRYINSPGSPAEGSGYGWGWWCPTDFLVNSYETGDPRYKATVLEETDSLLVAATGGNIWVTPNYTVLRAGTGLHRNQRKYECNPDEAPIGDPWKEGPTNIKMIRYADVLLFAAEAYFELGDQTNSLKYINMVRERARMSGNDPNVLPAITAVDHEAIEQERLVELACEGHRYWDVIRWNLGTKYLDHQLADNYQVDYIEGQHEFFPIPAAEVALSGGVLEQYPGW